MTAQARREERETGGKGVRAFLAEPGAFLMGQHSLPGDFAAAVCEKPSCQAGLRVPRGWVVGT